MGAPHAHRHGAVLASVVDVVVLLLLLLLLLMLLLGARGALSACCAVSQSNNTRYCDTTCTNCGCAQPPAGKKCLYPCGKTCPECFSCPGFRDPDAEFDAESGMCVPATSTFDLSSIPWWPGVIALSVAGVCVFLCCLLLKRHFGRVNNPLAEVSVVLAPRANSETFSFVSPALWLANAPFDVADAGLPSAPRERMRMMLQGELAAARAVRLSGAPYPAATLPSFALLDYSPLLPLVIESVLSTTWHQTLAPDFLQALELWQRTPLVDRCDVLHGRVRTKVVDPIPRAEGHFDLPLRDIFRRRAREIFDSAHAPAPLAGRAPREVWVLWSGGVASTATLLALLRVREELEAEGRPRGRAVADDQRRRGVRHSASGKSPKSESSDDGDGSGDSSSSLTDAPLGDDVDDVDADPHDASKSGESERLSDADSSSSSSTIGGAAGKGEEGEDRTGGASTAAHPPLPRLVAVYTEDSAAANPAFFKDIVSRMPKRCLPQHATDVVPAAVEAPHPPPVIVTGELARAIFGLSDRIVDTSSASADLLAASWRTALPELLVRAHVIPASATAAWVAWFSAQVERAPVPVETVLDFAWWFEFSLVWQHLTMRLFRNWTRGPAETISIAEKIGPKSKGESRNVTIHAQPQSVPEALFSAVEHFFRSELFQQWSYVHRPRTPAAAASAEETLREFIVEAWTHARGGAGGDGDGDTTVPGTLLETPAVPALYSRYWHPRASFNLGLDSHLNVIAWGEFSISKDLALLRFPALAQYLRADADDLAPTLSRWADVLPLGAVAAASFGLVGPGDGGGGDGDGGTSGCPFVYSFSPRTQEYVYESSVGGCALLCADAERSRAVRFAPLDVRLNAVEFDAAGGRSAVLVTEPFDEIVYLDSARLSVVEHPAGFEVFSTSTWAHDDETPSFVVLERASFVPPVRARWHDGRGRSTDVTAAMRTLSDDAPCAYDLCADNRYWLNFGPWPPRGSGRGSLLVAGCWLVVHGWKKRIVRRGLPAHVPRRGAILKIRDGAGRWVRGPKVSWPRGDRKPVCFDISSHVRALSPPAPRLEVLLITGTTADCSTLWFVDAVFAASSSLSLRAPGAAVTVTRIPPARAELTVVDTPVFTHCGPRSADRPMHNRLAARTRTRDGRVAPALGPHAESPQNAAAGRLTRFGDVTPLLQAESDDRPVVFGQGEGVELEFVLACPRGGVPGRARTCFLTLDCVYKPRELPGLLSLRRETAGVAPLPFHAMGVYPPVKAPPAHHRAYIAQWNTRRAHGLRPRPSLALSSASAVSPTSSSSSGEHQRARPLDTSLLSPLLRSPRALAAACGLVALVLAVLLRPPTLLVFLQSSRAFLLSSW